MRQLTCSCAARCVTSSSCCWFLTNPFVVRSEKVTNEILPDAEVPESAKQLHPGGQVFARPEVLYPGGKKAQTKLKGMPVSGRIGKLDFKRHSSIRVDVNGTARNTQ